MELIKNNIKFYDLILESTKTYEETTDAIVPDTFPDILRVASAVGSAQIKDEAPQNDRVLVSGTVKATILYVPENGEGLRKLDIPLNFAHIEEGKGITADSEAYVDCHVVSVDARVMNSRKVAVTAALCLSSKVYGAKELSLTSDAVEEDGLPLEILQSVHKVSVPTVVKNRNFTVMEDVELQNADTVADIVGSRGILKLSDAKLMPGKIILKGEAEISNLVLKTDNSLHMVSNTIPFTQIFDVDNVDEGQNATVLFSIKNLDCEKREGGVLSVGIGADACVMVYGDTEITTIADAYQIQYPVEAQSRTVSVCGERYLNDVFGEASETIPTGMKVASIIDSSAALEGIHVDGEHRATAMASVSVLYQSDDGQPYMVKRSIPVAFDLPENAGVLKVGSFTAKTAASLGGEDSIGIKVSAKGRLTSTEKSVLSDLQSLSIDTEHPKSQTNPVALVLRYVNNAERLWDVAKSYNTTMDAIRQANKLSSDQGSVSTQMLLIPIR